MFRFLQKLTFLLSLVIAANALIVALPIEQVQAATPKKKAKWQAPAKSSTINKKQKKKKSISKNKTTAKKPPTKKTTSVKKAAPVKAVKKELPKKKVKIEKPEENTLVVGQDFDDDDIALAEERSTSPLLIVFVTFVLCCVGGMLFLNQRKKQLEAAKMNFQEASNHELAFSSSQERLDSSHPTHSGHETPTTRTLFERTDRQERSSARSTPKEVSFFGKISSKAASLIKSGKTKGANEKKSKELAMQFDNEDMNSGSITTIGAVKSRGAKATSNPPVAFNPEATIEPMPANMGAEPCSFESYIEIQIAAQCWRAQKLSLDAKLRATFNIDTAALIQYEFYWKQKISNNVNLKKKYQELEPLYTAKYEAAS